MIILCPFITESVLNPPAITAQFVITENFLAYFFMVTVHNTPAIT